MEGYPTTSGEGEAIDLRERRPLAGIRTDTLDRAESVIEALEALVQLHPEFPALRCLSAERVEQMVTLGELWSNARRFQAHLTAAGAEPDRIIILAMSTGPDLVAAYLGALLAGGIPGLVASPTNRFADRQRYTERVTDILRNSGARVLCCDDGARALFTEVAAQREAPISILSPELAAQPISDAPIVPRRPTDLASIQYSSGTTAAPKGVLLTQGAIIENLRAMRDALRFDEKDVSVNWIPLYHDMGLIGASLLPLLIGSPTVLIPTMAFMKEPALWLWAVHHYGGTISWAPNFAYTI
ncbi:MAG: AMP-binding protein, partial [Candidatus Binatia bacterium]